MPRLARTNPRALHLGNLHIPSAFVMVSASGRPRQAFDSTIRFEAIFNNSGRRPLLLKKMNRRSA
jgi:hypothetical protein